MSVAHVSDVILVVEDVFKQRLGKRRLSSILGHIKSSKVDKRTTGSRQHRRLAHTHTHQYSSSFLLGALKYAYVNNIFMNELMKLFTKLHFITFTFHYSLNFLQAGCPSCRPTNSVKALKATGTAQSEDQPCWPCPV